MMRRAAPGLLWPAVLLLAAGCGHRQDARDRALIVHRDVALMLADSLARVQAPAERLEAAEAILSGMSDPPRDAYGHRLYVRATADGGLEVASAGPDGKNATADDLAVAIGAPR